MCTHPERHQNDLVQQLSEFLALVILTWKQHSQSSVRRWCVQMATAFTHHDCSHYFRIINTRLRCVHSHADVGRAAAVCPEGENRYHPDGRSVSRCARSEKHGAHSRASAWPLPRCSGLPCCHRRSTDDRRLEEGSESSSKVVCSTLQSAGVDGHRVTESWGCKT